MRPISETLGSLDISSGNSEDFNKLIKSIGYDITNVFNAANDNEQLTEENMNIVIQENLFLQRKIKELEGKLSIIEATMSNRSGIGYKNLYKSFYTTKDIESGAGEILHDASYGIITLPHANSQKIQLLKYPREFLQNNIDIKVSFLDQTIDTKHDPSLLNIIDGDEATFWTTEINTGDTVSNIDFTVTINMPLRILPSLSINSIGVKPHPIYSMTLKDITYTNAGNGVEYRMPTYPVDNNQPVAIQQIDNVKFMFPPVVTNSLTFKFTQPYYIQNGSNRKFVIGLRNIDLENLNITAEQSSFMTTFHIPGDNHYFLRIMEPSVTTLNNEVYSDAVTHELYYDKTGAMPFSFGSDIAADIDTVYIKTTLHKTGETIPALKGIRLQYIQK